MPTESITEPCKSKYVHFDKDALALVCKNNFIDDAKRNSIMEKAVLGDDTILDDLRSIQGDVFDPDDLDIIKDLIDYVQVVQKKEKEKG